VKQFVTREHEIEPIPGLPGELPEGETIVWQGKPDAKLVGRRVLKMRWIGGYFVVLALWAILAGFNDGRTLGGIVFSAGVLALLGMVLIGMLELFAWAVEKTTLYTITNKRVVMRIGVALSVTLNLPYRQIASAAVSRDKNGTGSIALSLKEGHRISWLMQWPHARAWRFAQTEPSLICLENVEEVAGVLASQLKTFAGEGVAQRVAVRPDHNVPHEQQAGIVAAE